MGGIVVATRCEMSSLTLLWDSSGFILVARLLNIAWMTGVAWRCDRVWPRGP